MRPIHSHSLLLEQGREGARIANKRRYQRMIGIALGAAGLAVALAGMPLEVTVGFWAVGAASWAILKRV